MTDNERTSLELELLQRANERHRLVNDHYTRIHEELDAACAQMMSCASYADVPHWDRQRVSPEAWAARRVVRVRLNGGDIVRHELVVEAEGYPDGYRPVLVGEAASLMWNARDESQRLEKRLEERPHFIRAWETERDLLRELARDVRSGALGTKRLTSDDV